jgi:hypothetical protein
MKRILIMCSVLAITLVSCKKETTEENTTEIVRTDSVTVKQELAPPPPPQVEPRDGTSINVNSDGVNIDSKDGTNKTRVNVSKDNAGLEINR